jgi:hypothetical protein
MFAHGAMCLAGSIRLGAATILGRGRFAAVLILCGVVLQACSGAPAAPGLQPDPSNPQARVKPAAYRPVLGGYKSQRPAEPLPWRERNERVTPEAKP